MSSPQFNRTPIYIALGLAVSLVFGILISARIVSDQVRQVHLSVLDAPDSQSVACTELIDALPRRISGISRAGLIDPAPAGAAAWSAGTEGSPRVTLRCGVRLPREYQEFSQPIDFSGVSWLRIAEPGADLVTWYAVNRNPVVAITAAGLKIQDSNSPAEDISTAVKSLEIKHWDPAPLPFAEVAISQADLCADFAASLPAEIAGFQLVQGGLKPVWTKLGSAPITAACGLDLPAEYEAGVRLNQVNEVAWLNTEQGSYALNRKAIVGLSLPSAASSALVDFSNYIAATIAPAEALG
ncbi:DUF3515 family protein [Corynebacterium caspium]|uniref:DUF3515 family protein n=1 Tax=Corynebacterium caspium TaxID=234828 RepID=UPI00036902D6|nr:DUF3515 family protein [Corynebacterium caspium]WKD59398.1 hypothetical protein CCASP_05035 [Corynebacterium caspium DSM 44850]